MKMKYLTIIVCSLVIISGNVTGQIVTSKNDTVRLMNEPLVLKVNGVRGDVQWQYSNNAAIWNNISGKTGDTLLLNTVENEGWYRAKITEGTCLPVYSDTASVEFTTPITETLSVDSVTHGSARLFGQITDNGGTAIIEKGFYWSSEDSIPGTASNIITVKSGTSYFDTILTGLNSNTTYYVKAFATNSKGTASGNVTSFKTTQEELTGTFVDTRDNKNYGWAKIGSQVWMSQNLAYLPAVSPPATGSETAKHYYVYGYEGTNVASAKATANYITYGVLYNWPAAMNNATSSDANPSGVQGVCPSGWHMPSDTEWIQLENYLIANGFNFDGTTVGNKIAKSLSAKTNWDTSTANGAPGNNLSANNSTGFSALPAGARMDEGYFWYLNENGIFWSSMQDNTSQAFKRYIFSFHPALNKYWDYKSRGLSVRCIMDESNITVNQPPQNPSDPNPVNNILGVSLTPTLSWQGSDPDGDPLTYDLYLGTSSTPSTLIIGNLTDISYTLSATLQGSTDYYWKVVAKDNNGNSTSSPVWKFTTTASQIITGVFSDIRDSKSYNWVQIGTQIWMSENLAYLPAVSPASTGSTSAAHYYVYNYTGTDVATAKATENYNTYGVLYNWTAAKTACPAGWHLATYAEWTQLGSYLSDNGYNYDGTTGGEGNKIAKSLAAKVLWNTHTSIGVIGNDLSANNRSGFTALPGGYRLNSSSFSYIKISGFWWTSTESSGTKAFNSSMMFSSPSLMKGDNDLAFGFSVRCVKD
jgi:uncharacterized protein (TIGR02145 family)